ncbi:adenylate/guanylate cyclase domain-containing protein [bacterium]|nr:adenylate/guanylate cyclase domain-containing protein [bacterium]
MRRQRTRLLIAGVLLWLLTAASAPWWPALPGIAWLDGQLENAWFQLRGPRPTSGQVAIVAIDDASLAQLPAPTVYWGTYYAEAVRRLSRTGAEVIALDIYFAELPLLGGRATEAERQMKALEVQANTELGAALAEARFVNNCMVLLAAFIEDGRLKPPRQELIAGAGGGYDTLGAINLLTTTARDEVVREFALRWPAVEEGSPDVISLPYLAAHELCDPCREAWYSSSYGLQTARINYAGPAGTIPRISLADVIRATPEELAELSAQWRGGLVFIGDTAMPQDTHVTPYSRPFLGGGEFERMPGVELLANVTDATLAGRQLEPLPSWPLTILAAMMLLLSGLAIYLWPWLAGVLVDLGLAAGVASWGYYWFLGDTLVPVGALIALLIVHGALARLVRNVLLERERRRLAHYFSRYTSPQALKHVLDDEERRLLAGERCEVVVMFYDIRGFTTMSERAEPDAAIAFLTAFHDRMAGIIAAHGGWVDKFLGDGALVIFGFPISDPGAPLKAVGCAKQMIAAAADFTPLSGEGRVAIGVGLHFGPVVIGNVGSATKLDFTAIGDTVNTAARVQDLCKQHGRPLLMTGELAAYLGRDQRLVALGAAQVRGRSAVELYTCASAVSEE